MSNNERSFAFCFVPARVLVEQRRGDRDLGVLRVRGLSQWKISSQQMASDIVYVSLLIRQHNDADSLFRVPRDGAGESVGAAIATDYVAFSEHRPAERLFAAAAGWSACVERSFNCRREQGAFVAHGNGEER